jgi:pyridoxal phosphate enzyme (YggS family)
MTISENLQHILKELGPAKLVAVTKYATAEQIQHLYAAGQRVFGESRIQVAKDKVAQYPEVEWHLIGHLQTNKAKQAVQLFSLIHSVDSLRLAEAISKAAVQQNKTQDILIQVNIGKEPQKSGCLPEETQDLVSQVRLLPNIRVRGLMAMAPLSVSPEETRPYFKQMKVLFETIGGLSVLSMGMSGDYKVAVAEGATLVRIGSALFN